MSRSANTEGSDKGGKRVTKSESNTKGVENLQPTARSLSHCRRKIGTNYTLVQIFNAELKVLNGLMLWSDP